MPEMTVTPGLKYFRARLLEKFEPRPEHKTTRQRMKHVEDILNSVRHFDDIVLLEAVEAGWTTDIMPTVKAWLTACGRFQDRVITMNRCLRSLGIELNLDPFYTDPDLTKARPTMWWP